MNMKYLRLFIILFVTVLSIKCNKDKIDDQLPKIDMLWDQASPKNCDTLYIGETNEFKAIFTDNVELGSFSIDIHNNFDHHSHSTEVEDCELGPVKIPVKPFVFIKEYEIPAGNTNYQANVEIFVPIGSDEGDYHFFISLTDRDGWRAERGISVKLINR